MKNFLLTLLLLNACAQESPKSIQTASEVIQNDDEIQSTIICESSKISSKFKDNWDLDFDTTIWVFKKYIVMRTTMIATWDVYSTTEPMDLKWLTTKEPYNVIYINNSKNQSSPTFKSIKIAVNLKTYKLKFQIIKADGSIETLDTENVCSTL